MACPRCGCPRDRHWPEHGESTTACVDCLATSRPTTEPEGTEYAVTGPGVCARRADTIAEDG